MIISEPLFDIEKVRESRIADIDFDNLPFGRVFSDHMFVMNFRDGQWQKGKITPFANLGDPLWAIHF